MKKNKIIVVPLDERPCNYRFSEMMLKNEEYEVLVPPRTILGNQKTPTDTVKLEKWIFKNIKSADAIILSLDMYLYGGIIPSRLHNFSVEELNKKIENIKNFKIMNPNLKIYGYNLIMRCPSYNSDEEEPNYYEFFGKDIFDYGVLEHKNDLNILNEEEKNKYISLKNKIPKEYLEDYILRRKKNKLVNISFLNLIKNKIIDFGYIPQDDSSYYGFTAIDKECVRNKIKELNLEKKVLIYPGADEVANTLVARYFIEKNNLKLKIYIDYVNKEAKDLIPKYEDRALLSTLSSHLQTMLLKETDNIKEADLYLLVNNAKEEVIECFEQTKSNEYKEILKNKIKNFKNINANIGIADVRYSNGGDLDLLDALYETNYLYKIKSYAGWNTSSNTLGTVIPSLIFSKYNDNLLNDKFLTLRYVEDFIYDSIIKDEILKNLEKPYSFRLFDGQRGNIVKNIKSKLVKYSKKYLTEYDIRFKDVYSPWNRLFEIGIELEINYKMKEKLVLNGIPVAIYNDKNNKNKKPLLFYFHGLTGNKDNIMNRGYILAKKGFYVVAIDAYMHGERKTKYFKEVMKRHDSYIEIVNVIIQTAKDAKEIYYRFFKDSNFLLKNQVYIFGVSMGAGISFVLGTILREVKAISTIVGSPSLYEFFKLKQQEYKWEGNYFFDKNTEYYKKYDPLIHYKKFGNKLIYMGCGERDINVPPVFAKRLKELRPNNTILEMYDIDHFSCPEMVNNAYDFLLKAWKENDV